MSVQSSYLNKKGLTVKDLVTIGIFTALFFVFEIIGSLPFAPNPALTFYQPFGIALLCGPVYLLMVAQAWWYCRFGHYQWYYLVCTRNALGNGFGICRHGHRS